MKKFYHSSQNKANIVKNLSILTAGASGMLESIAEALERIHRDTAPTIGHLSLTIQKRKINPHTLKVWSNSLKRGSEELLKLAEKMEKKNVHSS